jgi:GT2 family glycosyltransferase
LDQSLPPDSHASPVAARSPVIAGIVTYNRKELVCRCVEACLSQTSPPDSIFIFDNASTDGTREQLGARGYLADPRIRYYSAPNNMGPAGAFDQIFRLAWQAGCGWLWIMDDDVIPSPTALQMLKEAFAENFSSPQEVGFLASAIISGDGLPNNVPEIEMRRPPGKEPVWAELLGRGLVRLRWTTLCSVLIPRSTLDRCGGINPDFYAAGFDPDFALRVTNELPGYLVGKSVVTHLRQVSGQYNILRENDPERIKSHYYNYRNLVYVRRKYYGFTNAVFFFGKSAVEAIQALFVKEYPFLRAKTIIRAIVTGFFFRTADRPIGPAQVPLHKNEPDGAHCLVSGEINLDDSGH